MFEETGSTPPAAVAAAAAAAAAPPAAVAAASGLAAVAAPALLKNWLSPSLSSAENEEKRKLDYLNHRY